MSRLDEIAARASAAQPGPWHAPHLQDGTDDGWENSSTATGEVFLPRPVPDPEPECADELVAENLHHADADFIAYARTDLPDLLVALQRVRDHHPKVSDCIAPGDWCIRCDEPWPCHEYEVTLLSGEEATP